MFGSLGAPEIILIFVVALLVFGPRRLPEIGRKVGGILRDLRRSTGDFRSSVEREIGLDPASTGVEEIQRARRDLLGVVSEPLRDVTSGAREAVRDAREAVLLPPGRGTEPPAGEGPAKNPAGSVPTAAPSGTQPSSEPAGVPTEDGSGEPKE